MNQTWIVGQANRFTSTFSRDHGTMWKCLPYAFGLSLDGIISSPVLHLVPSCIRIYPSDANAVDHLILREVKNHPLRMERIAFSSKTLREVGIALPISIRIAVRKPRKTGVPGSVVARRSPMRQRISIRVANHFPRCGRARKVAFPTGIAPRSPRIPVPRLHR